MWICWKQCWSNNCEGPLICFLLHITQTNSCRVFINTEYFFSSNPNPLKIFPFSQACKPLPHWYKNSSFSLTFILPSSCTYRSVNYLYRQELSFTVLFLNPRLSYTLNLFIISPQLSNAISLPMCNWQRQVQHCNGGPFEILENTSKKQVLVPLVVVRTAMASDFFNDKPNHRS